MVKYDFNDILIQPAESSDIISRSEINPYYEDGLLPIITAPMDTVIDKDNHINFFNNKIRPCMPRNEKYVNNSNTFHSYSLTEFQEILDYGYQDDIYLRPNKLSLIDVANGHMSVLEDIVKRCKELYGDDVILMVGNIANPETYKRLSDAGADLIRVGIGNGGGCLTTQQLGVGYPMGSLINECYEISLSLDNPAKIVADGGMKTYSDIIKALALGADYVMLGSILNKALESAGNNYVLKYIPIPSEFAEKFHTWGFKITKKFRGMSTKEVQKKWGKVTLKTSEGVVKRHEVEYTLEQWVENFTDYLKSAMSYTNSKTLEDFIGRPETNQITDNAYLRFKK